MCRMGYSGHHGTFDRCYSSVGLSPKGANVRHPASLRLNCSPSGELSEGGGRPLSSQVKRFPTRNPAKALGFSGVFGVEREPTKRNSKLILMGQGELTAERSLART